MLSAAISLAFTPYSRPTSCGEGATCCEEAFLPPFGDMSAGLGRDRRIGRSCESGAWEAILSAAISPAFWPYTRPASWGKLGPKGDEFRCAASAGANGEEAGGVLMASISNEESVEKNTGSAAISRGDHEVSRSETRLSAIRLSSHAPRKFAYSRSEKIPSFPPSSPPGKKDKGGSRDTHAAGAQGHTDHTDEPHNNPNTPTHNPHVSATAESNRGRLNSRKPGADRSPRSTQKRPTPANPTLPPPAPRAPPRACSKAK